MPGFRQWHRLKKRAVLVALLVFAVVLLVSGLISWYAATLPGPADITRFTVSESDNRQQVLGAGLSLSGISTANLIEDASFEPMTVQSALTVQQAEENALSVVLPDSSDLFYQEGFFEGAAAEVYAWEQDQMLLKSTARVTGFGTSRISRVQPFVMHELQIGRVAFQDMIIVDNHVWAVGERGLLFYDLTGTNRQQISINTDEDLIAIDFHPEAGFYACSRQGSVFYSANGFEWKRVNAQADFVLNDIAVSERGIYAAAGDDGRILAGRHDLAGMFCYLQDKHNINEIIYHQNQFFAAGDKGLLYSSNGGMIWRKEPYFSDVNWQAFYEDEQILYLAGHQGQLALRDTYGQYQPVADNSSYDLSDLIVLPDGQLIATDRNGKILTASQTDDSWQVSVLNNDLQITRLLQLDAERLLMLDNQGLPGSATLVTEITLDRVPAEGVYQAGDLIYLKQTQDTLSAVQQIEDETDEVPEWQISGPGKITKTDQMSAPGGGIASLIIDRSQIIDPTPSSISQIIQYEGPHFSRNDIYQIELWLRHDGDTAGSADVWLSGSFESQYTRFDYIGTEWKKYTYSFVMPAVRLTEDEPVKLNIAYNSKGKLFIDRVFLGRAVENPNDIQKIHQSFVSNAKPAVIRFETLGLGHPYTAANSWSYPLDNHAMMISDDNQTSGNINALCTALQLSQNVNAEPWLVIESYMSQEEMSHLIEYLAAPISEPFGRTRQQNGSILPWTEQFGRIYLEFSDENHAFQLDQHRAAYVNAMIMAVTDSPYFARYKQQFIFVDGMSYDEGVMLSNADYHASDMQLVYTGDNEESINQTLQRYYHAIPRVPDRPASSASSLKRTSYYAVQSESPSMGWLTHLMLVDLGEQSALANISFDLTNMTSEELRLHQAVSMVVSAAARGTPFKMENVSVAETLDATAADNPDEAMTYRQVYAYGFGNVDQTSFVLINNTTERHDIQLITDLNLEHGKLLKFNADGSILSETTVKHDQQKITLMPGGVALIIKNIQE